MKKGISVVLAFVCCLLLILPTVAYAVDAEDPVTSMLEENVDTMEDGISIGTFVTNEYDMYLEMQNTPTALLLENGYEIGEIEELKNTSVEEILYERGQMSEEELIAMGYFEGTIKLLKEYDGSPIEDNPQLYGIFADLSGDLSVKSYGKSKMAVRFTWEWSNAPLLSGTAITDVVSCGFAGTNNENVSCVMTFDKSNSECIVSYYEQGDDGLTYLGHKSPTISAKNVHNHVESRIRMSEEFNSGRSIGWAKKGYLTVAIKEENPIYQLYSGTFAFGYGHMVGAITPSISISFDSISIGLTFGTDTEEMFYKTITVDATGKFDIQDGE